MWHFLFGLRGRTARASFCLFATIAFGVLLVLLAALYTYQLMAGGYETGEPAPWPSTPLGMAGVALWFGSLLLLVIAAFCVTLRRLHDLDKSAWWLLLFVVAPNALSSCAQIWRDRNPGGMDEIAAALNLAALGIFAWAFIELACLKGTTGENRYGPDPLAR